MTGQWCTDRDHPFVTYNPWINRTYCRCGQRQHPGEQPMDWEAKHAIFHTCTPDAPCRCYATAGKLPGTRPAPPGETP